MLNSYETLSGQAINYQKSGVFFGTNVRRDKHALLTNILGVSTELGDGIYLGISSLVGQSKKTIFNFVNDRVWKKVQDWSNKLLSKSGK